MHDDLSLTAREQIAWAAGLFEGEGSMNATRQGKRGSGAQLRLGMTDRDVVARFAAIVGRGNIYIHRPTKASWKPCHTWCLYEAAAVCELLEEFIPFFGERRAAKAREVLDAAREIDVHKGLRTHCPQNHPYSGDNLVLERITRGGKTYFARRCKICRAEQARDRKRKKT